MKSHRVSRECCAGFAVALLIAGCGVDTRSDLPDANRSTGSTPVANLAGTATQVIRNGGVLVSPELFDLVAQWSNESLSATAARYSAAPDLVSYARAKQPALVEEATRVLRIPSIAQVDSQLPSTCRCAVWGAWDTQFPDRPHVGRTWTTSISGPAHTAHIYQVERGSRREDTAASLKYSTQLRTRMICMTSQDTACAAGCSAKLYTDAHYGSTAYAEAHTWTIWDKAGTTQVSDGMTLQLLTPNGGPGTRLLEKAVSASQSATSTAFQPDQLASALKNGLGIYAAIQTNTLNLIPDLTNGLINSLFGVIRHQGGSDGSFTQQMNVSYQSFHDSVAPIDMYYTPDAISPYTIVMTSEINMKVRGWGYHSETGDLNSSYSIAVFIDNFVCDSSVVETPQRAGFWHYDGYAGAPLGIESLQSRINSFFQIALGTSVPVASQNPGTILQGECNNHVCEAYETPFTCAADCGSCGNGTCNSLFENAQNCVSDCGYCGDGTCYGSEDASSCLNDCGYCGDGVCFRESVATCPGDCQGYCGDGVCESGEVGQCDPDCGCNDGICMPN